MMENEEAVGSVFTLVSESAGEKDTSTMTASQMIRIEEKASRGAKLLRTIWSTRMLTDVEDKRTFIKIALRELVIYTTYLVLLMIISFLMMNTNAYYYYVSVHDLVVGPYDGDNAVAFDDIGSLDDIWTYMNSQLLDALYTDAWYNDRNVSDREKGFINFDNKLVGVPRLRQVRVDSSKCLVPPLVGGFFNKCLPAYSYENRGMDPIVPKGDLIPVYTKDAWTYKDLALTGSSSYDAQHGSYDGSGYVQEFSRERNVTQAILQELFHGRWLDEATRAMFLDFTIYNANINMFVIVKLIFEVPYTGGVLPSQDFQAARLLRYTRTQDYFVMICEVLFGVLVLYYIVEELLEICANKWSYFKSIWSFMDIIVIVISVMFGVVVVYTTIRVDTLMDQVIKQNNQRYAHFDLIGYWYGHYIRILSLLVFFAILKLFKYVNFDKSLGQLNATLAVAAADSFGLILMFLCIFFAFAGFSHLAFGYTSNYYRTFTAASYALFRMMVGDINFDELRHAHYVIGPLFFILFILLVFFVLMNMFLAIVDESYRAVKDKLASQKAQMRLGVLIKKSAKEMFARLKKKKRKTVIQILRENNLFNTDYITFDDFRKVLKNEGYGDIELTTTFVKYDEDGDNLLNLQEQKVMEAQLEIAMRKTKKIEIEEDEGVGSDKEDEGEENKEKGGETEYVDPEDYKELLERVAVLEDAMISIVSHANELVTSLEEVEQIKREHREKLVGIIKKQKGQLDEMEPEEPGEPDPQDT
ncbi:unnamed protein product [Calicophoron daubneyi]|uniref:Polycystic kidney disease 2-like 1 protein n=1 Tax=Calicophoron daubneyi TaxID=300641 RepID=A0AAV2TTX1_CALDB